MGPVHPYWHLCPNDNYTLDVKPPQQFQCVCVGSSWLWRLKAMLGACCLQQVTQNDFMTMKTYGLNLFYITMLEFPRSPVHSGFDYSNSIELSSSKLTKAWAKRKYGFFSSKDLLDVIIY